MLKASFLENSWGKKENDSSLLSLTFSPAMTVVLHKSVSFIKPPPTSIEVLSSSNLLKWGDEESVSLPAQKQCL